MMKRIYVSLLISICTIMAQAQTIAGYEYWFDNHFDSRSSQNTAVEMIIKPIFVSGYSL